MPKKKLLKKEVISRIPSAKIALHDRKTVRLEAKGRSPAYFCLHNPVRVGRTVLQELKKAARDLGSSDIRLCLHDSPSAPFHEMIVIAHAGKYYRPHKHEKKNESYHLIEGSAAIFVFENDGRVVESCVLKSRGNRIFRMWDPLESTCRHASLSIL